MNVLLKLLLTLCFFTVAPLLAEKPSCVIYGNCQFGVLHKYLEMTYPNLYEYTYIFNSQAIREKRAITDLCAKADLFIYQPIQGHGLFDTKQIKNEFLKPSCKTLSAAYLYTLGYFPDPYLESLKALAQSGLSIMEIYNRSQQNDFFSSDYIVARFEYAMQELERRERETDVKLSPYIRENYSSIRLFYTCDHPTNILLQQLIREISIKLGLPAERVDSSPLFNQRCLGDCTPILPSIVQTLGLEFDVGESHFHDKPVSDFLFMEKYLRPFMSPAPVP